MHNLARSMLMFAMLVTQATLALACAICAPAEGQNTLLYQLHAADAVVLAVAQAPGASYQVIELVKGLRPAGPLQVVARPPTEVAARAGSPVVLLYSAAAQSWRSVGALGRQRLAWLKRFSRFLPVSVTAESDWSTRLAFFVADLEDPEPLVAQAAYDEMAVAPYAAMRALRLQLDSERIRRWVVAPALVARRPLYTLLLGIAAGPELAQDLQALAEQAAATGSAADLSAALAACLEVRGAPGLAWIEDTYLFNPARPESQVKAAVLALGVHGSDGVRVSRDRVVASYARLMVRNPAMAGLAASDLANWGHWEFSPHYASILRSGAPVAFASRYAMVFYLMRNPQPQARALLESLRAAKVL